MTVQNIIVLSTEQRQYIKTEGKKAELILDVAIAINKAAKELHCTAESLVDMVLAYSQIITR